MGIEFWKLRPNIASIKLIFKHACTGERERERMADDAAKFLLHLLETYTVAHVNLIFGVREELNQLQIDVRTMKGALRDSDGRCWASRESQKEYERRVRDVLHEAEDILDECFTRAALNESRWFNNRFFSSTHFRLANQVKSIRNNTIKRLLDDFHILPTPQPSLSTPPVTTDQPNGEVNLSLFTLANPDPFLQNRASFS